MLDDGKVVEAFLDQEPDDAVRVKDEVRSRGSLVPDQTVLPGREPDAKKHFGRVDQLSRSQRNSTVTRSRTGSRKLMLFVWDIRHESDQLRRLRQDQDIVVRDVGRDGRRRLLFLGHVGRPDIFLDRISCHGVCKARPFAPLFSPSISCNNYIIMGLIVVLAVYDSRSLHRRG